MSKKIPITGPGKSNNPRKDGGSSSSTAESDATSAQSDATTVTAQIELPDEGEMDIRRMILDDYERCLCRHDVSFTDLLRIHKKQSNAAMKLTISLDQAKKKEAAQKEKAEDLGKKIDDIKKGLAKDGDKDQEYKKPSGRKEDVAKKAEELKQMIRDIRAKIEELRRKKEDVDRRYAEAKAREGESGDGDEPANKKREEIEETLAKLAREIDETKREICELLREMNQAFQQLNKRLNSDYKVPEEPDGVREVQVVLDNVLYDVSKMVEGKRRLEEELEEMKLQIVELEKHIAHAEKMNQFLDREVEKLLAIGERKEAKNVDRQDYNQVIKFVEETFNILISKLKGQNKEIDDQNDALKAIEKDNDRKQKEYEQEMVSKQSKLDHVRRQIDIMKFQNEALRNSLMRAPKSPVASESQTKQQLDKLKSSQQEAEDEQLKILQKQLQRVKGKNDDARKELNELTKALNELGEELRKKRQELEELRRKGNRDIDDENQKCQDLERQIDGINKEIERLNTIMMQPPPEEEDNLNDVEKALEEKLKELEAKLRQAEAEKAKLTEQYNKLKNERNKAHNQLFEENQRRDDLEDKLEEIKDKINDLEKRLAREREKGFEIERECREYALQNMEFQQTTITRFVSASGTAQTCTSNETQEERQGGFQQQPAISSGREQGRQETEPPPRSRSPPARSDSGERQQSSESSGKNQCGQSRGKTPSPTSQQQPRESRYRIRKMEKEQESQEEEKFKQTYESSKQKRTSQSQTSKQRRKSSSKSGKRQIELQITPEITLKHQGSSDPGEKTYDVTGNLILTMERDSTSGNGTSSGVPSNPENADDDQKSIDTSSQ